MPATPRGIEERRTALRTAAIFAAAYGCFGVIWIFASDAIASWISSSPEEFRSAQRFERLAFITLTALAVLGFLRHGYLRAVHAAQDGEVRVQDLFLSHPRPMWLYDVETLRFLTVNEAAVSEYGYSKAEFLTMTLRDIRPAEEVGRMREAVRLDDGEPHRTGVFQHVRKDGAHVFVDITSHVVPYLGRKARLVIAQDVTAETAARGAFAVRELQFRQLHDSLQEALWLSAPDRPELLYVSPGFDRIYGRSGDDLLADPLLWRKVVVDEDLPAVSDAQAMLHRTGISQCDYRIKRPDGTRRWVRDRRRNIVDEKGNVLMVSGMVEDVTEATETALALRELTQQLEKRVAERTEELHFVNQELDAFSRTAAHDLKNPLNGIIGFIEILRIQYKHSLGAEGDRMASHIQTSAEHMAVLIDDLLALSRVTTHDLEPRKVDLAAISNAAVDDLRASDPAREVAVSIRSPMYIQGDQGLLRSLMANLIGNAWKFTSKQPSAHIEVGCQETEDGWAIHFVKDNGAGFDMRDASKVFEPFRRFHSNQEFAGTGVGLATCQRIVRRHGGSIWINSKQGSGTTVYFSLTRSGMTGHPPSVPKDSFFATLD